MLLWGNFANQSLRSCLEAAISLILTVLRSQCSLEKEIWP